ASRAAQRGVRLRDGHTVTAIGYDSNRIPTVHTDHGDFRAEIVVVCAGKNVGELAAMTGLELPVTTLLPLYAETTTLPEPPRSAVPRISARAAVETVLRQEDFEPCWQQGRRMLPNLGEAKVDTGTAAPLRARPDGNPLRGEHSGIDGRYFAAAMPDTQSAGAT